MQPAQVRQTGQACRQAMGFSDLRGKPIVYTSMYSVQCAPPRQGNSSNSIRLQQAIFFLLLNLKSDINNYYPAKANVYSYNQVISSHVNGYYHFSRFRVSFFFFRNHLKRVLLHQFRSLCKLVFFVFFLTKPGLAHKLFAAIIRFIFSILIALDLRLEDDILSRPSENYRVSDNFSAAIEPAIYIHQGM